MSFHRVFNDRGRRSSRHAHAASARAAPPLQKEAAQWRTSALHAQAGSRSGRRGRHVGARPFSEIGRPLARAVLFQRAWSDHGQRSAARAGGDRAHCASSPKRGSAVAHKRATRANRLTKWTPQLARGSTALPEERRPFARCVLFHRVRRDHRRRSSRRTRAASAPDYASSPETASAGARKRTTRASRLTKRTPWLVRGSTAFHRITENSR